MAMRLIRQSRQLTAAALTPAKPKGKLTPEWSQTHQECHPTNTAEAEKLLDLIKKEAISRAILNNSLSDSLMTEIETLEEGMGSFPSTGRVNRSSADQDEDVTFIAGTQAELLARCQEELEDLPEPFDRNFSSFPQHTLDENIDLEKKATTTRVFQWNLLSQTLGTKTDNFVRCDSSALEWTTRRWRILEEIIRYDPDVVCLQEVDHFKLIKKALGSIGYHGRFVQKPDSPCLYLDSNNGPDGCAIFYKKDKFEMISKSSRVLKVWGVASNQVVLGLNLRHKESGKEICVATTHLKARSGALLSTLRNEQGKDILDWLETISADRPVILSGDFNAEPSESVYSTMTSHKKSPLQSSYTIRVEEDTEEDVPEDNLEYTTWKIRETGEQKSILDYIFHSPQLKTVFTLDMPTEEQIGEDRLPSRQFASDHLSLAADIQF